MRLPIALPAIVLILGCAGSGGSNRPIVPPTFTDGPQDAFVMEGQDAKFTASVVCSGPIAITWEVQASSSEWVKVEGASSEVLTVHAVTPAMSMSKYRCRAESAGVVAFSGPASLFVAVYQRSETNPAPPAAPV